MCLLRRFFLLVFLSVFSSLSFASVGKLVLVTGKVEVERANQMLGVKTGDSIYKSDHIYTRSNSSAQVKFTDDTAITLGANTDLKVQEVLLDGKKSEASFSVGRGGL